jgi:molybdopterin molybdotransferase
MLEDWPAQFVNFQRVADDRDVTIAALTEAAAAHDVIVTVGGASVGDHDHVHAALTSLGAAPDFWKVAMRPGKPVLAARLGQSIVLGLPGNPASAFVTAHLFLLPLLRHLAGAAAPLPPLAAAPLAEHIGPGGARRDYLRAVLADGALTPCASQDSGFVTALAEANALVVREAGTPPRAAGTIVPYLAI